MKGKGNKPERAMSSTHKGISTLRMEIGTLGVFHCFCDVHGHTKPIGIESKYFNEPLLIGGWMVGVLMVDVVTSVQKSPTCVHT